MKRIYYFVTVLSVALLGLASCTSEEDSLFPESAAQRLNKSVDYYHKLLQSSDKGWAMQFYPSDGSMGGYVYTAKFFADSVAMASELSFTGTDGEAMDPGTIVNSKYSVKSEQSIILSFDTYNPIFHFFSEPQGSDDVDGYESDYEFVFMRASADEDTIFLRGKKYDNSMVMVKLKDNPGDYISKVLQQDINIAFAPRQEMVVDGKSYPVTFDSKLFTYTDVDNNNAAVSTPYIYDAEGFHLYTPITVNGHEYQDFVYDETTGNVTSTDGTAVIPMPSALDQFLHSKYPWMFQASATQHDMSDELYTKYWKANNYSSSYEFRYAYIGPSTEDADIDDGFEYVISFFWEFDFYGYHFPTNANYGIDIKVEDEAKGIFSLTGLGEGYGYYGSTKTAADSFIQAVLAASPYQAKFNDGFAKSEVTFTSTKDPGVWFTLRLNSALK